MTEYLSIFFLEIGLLVYGNTYGLCPLANIMDFDFVQQINIYAAIFCLHIGVFYNFTNMVEFVILKTFNVKILPPKTLRIKVILWHLPLISWIKYNSDGAAHGISDNAACGGLFKDY
ncbi:hypothetical protein QL285_012286 [Trifolium repens]|jgi:hypothetical protein|nr:hypothetical protein QL285_012286 [Trifolium repens]